MANDNAAAAVTEDVPNEDDFRILEVINDGLYNFAISAPLSTTPMFHVINTYFTFGKPSIVLRSGAKDGPVLGFMKLVYKGKDIVGLGTPDAIDTNYEELRRLSSWRETEHEFDFGSRGEMRTFVWVRTKARYIGDQPDLELREKLAGRDEDRNEGEYNESVKCVGELGNVLAVYKGCQGLMTKKRGTFYLKKHDGGGEGEGDEFWHKGRTPGCSDWELMVLLTACGLIEEGRRRARARYLGASNIS